MRRHFLLSVWLVLLPAFAYGQSISVVWDANPPEDQVTGYEVCISTTPLSCNVERASVSASETAYAFTPTPGVLYRFAVRAVNDAGPGAYTPEVTASIPALTQPPNQTSTLNNPVTPLILSASDPDGSALQFSHSGLPFGLSLNANTGIISGTPWSAGAFNVTVFVSDNLETTARTFVWTIQGNGSETSAPALTITSHTSGQTVTTSSITLAGTASDSGNGGSGIVSVTVNGAAATGGTASGSNTANWSRNVSLSTGANTLTVVATDGAGNVRTATLTITRTSGTDNTAPTLTITSHTPGQTVGASSITLSGTASDSGSGGSGITSVTVNGAPASGGTASGSGTANWSSSVTLASGANTLTVVATDGAGNARATPISITYAVSAVTSVTLTPLLSSPRTTGTSITFSAVGSGGVSPRQYKFLYQRDGETQQVLRGWSTSSTYTWTPTIAGSYVVTVWARSAGVTTNAPQASAQIPYVITGPLAATSIIADVPSPQNIGTTVTFTAAATGGTAPYSYKWWVLSGGNWTMARDWSTSPNFAWTPSGGGSYQIGIWVRGANTTADTNAVNFAIPYVINAGPSLVATGISANLASPQPVGTTVTFAASATGGTAPYQFKWWVLANGVWTVARGWSTNASLTWQPTSSGTYTVAVWVRNAGVTADASQALAQVNYVVSQPAGAPAPLAITSLTSTLASPQPANTSIMFTAAATGGTAPYQFKWWVLSGGVWSVAQDWSTSTSLTWRPASAGTYVVAVWSRNAGVTADASQAMTQVNYVVSQPAGAPAPLAITSLTSTLASPLPVNTSITFTAAATGGTAPYQFKWWVLIGGVWTVEQDWSTSNSLTIRPDSAGTYVVAVWSRNAGVTADASQAMAQVPLSVY